MDKKLAISLLLNGLLAIAVIGLSFQLMKLKEEKPSSFVKTAPKSFEVEVTNDDIVFMGEDRIEDCKWAHLLAKDNVKTLAFAGNTIEEDVRRMDALFKNAQPLKIVLMYGEQELYAGATVGEIATSYGKLLSALKERFPATEVIVISTLPVNKFSDHDYNLEMAENTSKLNMLIKSYAFKNGYPFIDVFKDFSDAEGILSTDYVGGDGFSLMRQAYTIIKSRLKDYLN